jgi:hypothetical protein
VTSNPRLRAAHKPIYDVHPLTGSSIEVFYADRTLETFGRCGWFWSSRQRGCSPAGPATGPFGTSYAAYQRAFLGATLGAERDNFKKNEANQKDSVPPWRREWDSNPTVRLAAHALSKREFSNRNEEPPNN